MKIHHTDVAQAYHITEMLILVINNLQTDQTSGINSKRGLINAATFCGQTKTERIQCRFSVIGAAKMNHTTINKTLLICGLAFLPSVSPANISSAVDALYILRTAVFIKLSSDHFVKIYLPFCFKSTVV